MKNLLVLLVIVFAITRMEAQTNVVDEDGTETPIYVDDDDNVGIGTSSPMSKLNVYTKVDALDWNTTISNEYHSVDGNAGVGLKFKLGYSSETSKWAGIYAQSVSDWENTIDLAFVTKDWASDPAVKMIIKYNGSVGIGTTDPTYLLDVQGGARLKAAQFGTVSGSEDNGWLRDVWLTSCTHSLIWDETNDVWVREEGTYNDIGGIIWQDEGTYFIREGSGDQVEFTNTEFLNTAFMYAEMSTGNIGIGNISPDYKLDVTGTIRAEEILVEASGNTADFVFSDDYQLKDLTEVENFILTNNHLPDIPSATEMEEQGVNLAEMNKLLLQKVEELTLYAIEKDKEVARMEDAQEILKNRLEKLEQLVLK